MSSFYGAQVEVTIFKLEIVSKIVQNYTQIEVTISVVFFACKITCVLKFFFFFNKVQATNLRGERM